MIKIDPKQTTKPELFKHMLNAIGPRPIALASTIDKEGKPNLAPFSFFNIFGINPPTLIFSPSRRGKEATLKNTYENIKDIPEVVINVVSYEMVQQTNLSSTEFEKGINEFEKAGFTEEDSTLVKPYRVKESPVQIECKVVNVIETGSGGGAGNLVICEIVMVHANENILNDDGFIDTAKIKLVGRMGGNYWCKAFGDAIFEVKKPIGASGIGIDNIPLEIRMSKVLTGNDLGKLGMIDQLPDKKTIQQEKKNKEIAQLFSKNEKSRENLIHSLHTFAKHLLEHDNIEKAWNVLLTIYD